MKSHTFLLEQIRDHERELLHYQYIESLDRFEGYTDFEIWDRWGSQQEKHEKHEKAVELLQRIAKRLFYFRIVYRW